jgi:hypothetical protein
LRIQLPSLLFAGAIKKLPQAGQEPVEAVESGHSNPDACYANRKNRGGKDIMREKLRYFAHAELIPDFGRSQGRAKRGDLGDWPPATK